MGDTTGEVHDEERSPIAPYHLDNVEWRLTLQLAQSDLNKVLEPTGIVHFDLTSTGLDNKNKDGSFNIEFTQNELLKFVSNLDEIQSQLDDLV